MDRFTEICITLASEVLAICREEKIPCILLDESVRKLRKEDGSVKNLYLLVKSDHFDQLFDRLAGTDIPFRAVEGMKNNDRYPDFSMRYVDTSSTCCFKKDIFLYASIGIYIVPLRKNIENWKKQIYDRLEHWELGAATKLYPRLLKAYQMGGAQKGYVTGMKWNRSSYKTSELSGNRFLALDSEYFPVSSMAASRLGFAYQNHGYLFYSEEVRDLPRQPAKWGEVRGKNLFVQLLKTVLKKVKGRIWKKLSPINHDWDRIRCANERDLLKIRYEEKKPLIRELEKNKDMKRLKAELLPYHKKLVEYYKKTGITIVFDRDIFEIYKKVYGTGKRRAFVEKISKKVPKVWRSK